MPRLETTDSKRRFKKRSMWQQVQNLVQHPQETLILAVVSSLDVVMTYNLLTRGDGGFTESNPIARYFLDRWGMPGMAYFKMTMTLLVCVITQVVARKNSVLAKQVLELATLIIVVVVIYSVALHFRHHDIRPPVELDVSWSPVLFRLGKILNKIPGLFEASRPQLGYHVFA